MLCNRAEIDENISAAGKSAPSISRSNFKCDFPCGDRPRSNAGGERIQVCLCYPRDTTPEMSRPSSRPFEVAWTLEGECVNFLCRGVWLLNISAICIA